MHSSFNNFANIAQQHLQFQQQQQQHQQQQQQQQQQMMVQTQSYAPSETPEDFYLALLSLAEYFNRQSPPNVRHCVHCLMCIIAVKPSPKIETRTHLQLGSILLKYTKNYDMAIGHLERAMNLAAGLNGFSDLFFEAASLLAKAYTLQGKPQQAVACLQSVHRDAQNSSYWQCRILLQLSQLALDEGNTKAAVYYLQLGEEASGRFGAAYARIVFKLGHGMLLLVQREFAGVDSVLGACSQLINQYNDSPRNKEVCKIMFLIMQTCHFLYASQVITAAQPLKQLQDALQLLLNLPPESNALVNYGPAALTNVSDKFVWLNREILCIIVYTVTAMHELQSGRMERVRRNVDKALQLVDQYKATDARNPLINRLTLVLLENLVQSCLVCDKRSVAIQNIGKMISLLPNCTERISRRFEARIRLLLGFYYNVMGRIDVADWHLQSIQTQSLEAPDREFGFVVELSRCLLLAKVNRKSEATILLQRFDDFISAGNMNPPALIRASREYCIAVISLSQRKSNEARDALMRAIQLANADGLSRMGLLCRLLLGFIYIIHNNAKEARDALELASQSAKSTGDAELTVVSGRMLADSCYLASRLFLQQGAQQPAAVAEQMAQAYTADCGPYTQALMQDTSLARSLPEHNNLMMWPQQNLVGSPPHVSAPSSASSSHTNVQQQPQQVSPRVPVVQQQSLPHHHHHQQQPQQQQMQLQPQQIQSQPQQPQQQQQQQHHHHQQQQQQQQQQIQQHQIPVPQQQQPQHQQFLLNSPPAGLPMHAQGAFPFSPPMYSSGVPIGLSPQQIMQAQLSSAASGLYASMQLQEQQHRR